MFWWAVCCGHCLVGGSYVCVGRGVDLSFGGRFEAYVAYEVFAVVQF